MTKEFKILPVRIEQQTYKMLRKMAFLNEMSMAHLIREMIDKKIEDNKKVLTNSDIAI